MKTWKRGRALTLHEDADEAGADAKDENEDDEHNDDRGRIVNVAAFRGSAARRDRRDRDGRAGARNLHAAPGAFVSIASDAGVTALRPISERFGASTSPPRALRLGQHVMPTNCQLTACANAAPTTATKTARATGLVLSTPTVCSPGRGRSLCGVRT